MSELALPRSAEREQARGVSLLGDELLAKLVGRGSTHAFAVLYERHHQMLYRYCRSILHDPHDAEDALQSTMTQAFAALRASERDVSLRAWLFRIAHNESITIMRKRARTVNNIEETGVAAESEPEAVLADRARLRQLVADLQQLPERQRAALVMRELSGLRVEELASALAISPAAAKQALFEARRSLRELSEGREMDCEDVRLAISAHDRRVLRGRRIRAHLRACEGCRDFDAAIGAREADLRALAPTLPAPAAGAILAKLLGGGSWGGPAGGGGAGVAAGANSGLLAHAGGSLLVKAAAGVAVVAAAAAGTVRLTTEARPGRGIRTALAAPGSAGVRTNAHARTSAGARMGPGVAAGQGGAHAAGVSKAAPAVAPGGGHVRGGTAVAGAPAVTTARGHLGHGPLGRGEGVSRGGAQRTVEAAIHGKRGVSPHAGAGNAGRKRHGAAQPLKHRPAGSTRKRSGGTGAHRPAGSGHRAGGQNRSNAPTKHPTAVGNGGEHSPEGAPHSTGSAHKGGGGNGSSPASESGH
jgi:RNA polymerase sigma factor (sigma-70 family)